MKHFEIVMATTHLDRHSTRFTRESLEEAAMHLKGRYIPFLHEHDLLRPLGRTFGGSVRRRDDGEWELVAEVEVLEVGDTTAPSHPDLEFRPPAPTDGELRVIVGDEFLRDPKSRETISEFKQFLGRPVEYQGRRALEPPDLIMLAGVYTLGRIAEGFLTQLGADGYQRLKELIVRTFNTRPRRQRELRIDLWFQLQGVEVILIQGSPTPERLDALLSDGLQQLDALLPGILRDLPDTRRIVAEYGDDGLRIAYTVGADCLPRVIGRIGPMARGNPSPKA